MTDRPGWLIPLAVTASCSPVPFSQNIGFAHKVEREMTPADVTAIMGEPFERASIQGVDEWRYCSSRDNGDVFAVFYLHDGRVVDKASFTISREVRQYNPDGTDSCLDNVKNLYTDRRSPPRRVVQLRETGR
jgi:hypothetical protein